MLGFGGIYGRKPRQFQYNPRYYDPEKEARNKRRIELGLEPVSDDEKKPGDMLRYRRSISQERFEETRRARKSKSTRLTIVVLVLLAVLMWMLMSM